MGHYGPTSVHQMCGSRPLPPPPSMSMHGIETSMAGHMPPGPHATAAPYAPSAPYPNYPTPTSTPMTSLPSLPVSEGQLKKDRDEIYG